MKSKTAEKSKTEQIAFELVLCYREAVDQGFDGQFAQWTPTALDVESIRFALECDVTDDDVAAALAMCDVLFRQHVASLVMEAECFVWHKQR